MRAFVAGAPRSQAAATAIAAVWKGFLCRRRLSRARALPSDLWTHVRHFLREEDPESRVMRAIRRIVSVKILRVLFAPPPRLRSDFPLAARLARKYARLLTPHTLRATEEAALRLLVAFTSRGYPKPVEQSRRALACANVFLEWSAPLHLGPRSQMQRHR